MLHSILARRLGAICIAAFLILPGLGCYPAKEEVLTDTSLQQLEQRVRERWQALEIRDYEKVWEYSTPNYRSNFPKRLYAYNFSYSLDWELTGIQVVNYDAEAAVASVAVRVMSGPTKRTSVAAMAVGAVPVVFHEQWLYIDGEWWFGASL